MGDRICILSVEELAKQELSGVLWQQVLSRLDRERRQKAVFAKTPQKRAASAGAGLLIQWALWQERTGLWQKTDRAEEEGLECGEASFGGKAGLLWQELSLSEIFAGVAAPIEPVYGYSEKGKPYLQGNPFYFNLSHSGLYVAGCFSEKEAGIDIQYRKKTGYERVAERFFTAEEKAFLRELPKEPDRREGFYCLWTRKEAYGKLTGEGIGPMLSKDFSSLTAEWMKGLAWEERDFPEGYRTACCRRL